MKYDESKKIIDNIRNRNEVMFRMAISHLMDVGIRHLTEESIEETCAEIMKEDDAHHFMTNGFKCDLVRMAGELAKADHIHLLAYIQREVDYDVGDNVMSYGRATELLENCMDWMADDRLTTSENLDTLRYAGFEDHEIELLGFGYLLDTEEDEDYEN